MGVVAHWQEATRDRVIIVAVVVAVAWRTRQGSTLPPCHHYRQGCTGVATRTTPVLLVAR